MANFKHWHLTALQMAMSGAEVPAIAAELHKPKGTITRVLSSEWALEQSQRFQQAIELARARGLVDPIMRFQEKLAEKIDRLDALSRHDNPQVALAATREWIAHAIGTPVRRSEVDVSAAFDRLTPDELREVVRTGVLPRRLEAPADA